MKTIEELRAELVEAEADALINAVLDSVQIEARAWAEARSEARYENVAKIEEIKAKIEALKKDNELERLEDELAEALDRTEALDRAWLKSWTEADARIKDAPEKVKRIKALIKEKEQNT